MTIAEIEVSVISILGNLIGGCARNAVARRKQKARIENRLGLHTSRRNVDERLIEESRSDKTPALAWSAMSPQAARNAESRSFLRREDLRWMLYPVSLAAKL